MKRGLFMAWNRATLRDTAIAVHHTATVDEPWDGGAAEAAYPNDPAVLHYCYAWQDSSADDSKKSSYKFPHHKTKGGPANLPACRNGLARLDGSSIPEGDKAGVKKHLQAHLDDANASDIVRALPANLRARRDHVRVQVDPNRKWYDIRIKNDASAEVYLYDEIGWWGTSAAEFVAELVALQVPVINLHINSPGGEVFDGIAIHSALVAHPAAVNVFIDGMAASIASVIAMAGNSIAISKNAMIMIHDASGMCVGNAADMLQTGALLEKISDMIASFYADKAGGTPDEWRAKMHAETWLTGPEAVACGLADAISGAPAPTAEPAPVPADHWLTVLGFTGPTPTDPAVPDEPDDEPDSFDPEAFRLAMRAAFAAVPSDVEESFIFDADLFRSAVREGIRQ